jgi:DNA polymerase III delta prime subunit
MSTDYSPTTEAENPFVARALAQAQAIPKTEKRPKGSILSAVTTRKKRRPIFALLYGPPGVGKSTFGASLPKPIMIPTERGLDQITVPKLPIPRTFVELWRMIVALDSEEHPYGSIVIDTIDATELLIFDRVCEEAKVESIEAAWGGWQKGYMRAREIWRGLLEKLTAMSERYNILLIGHSQIKTKPDPHRGSYDQHQMRIQEKSADLIRQTVDLILFANLEMTVSKDNAKAKSGRAIFTGNRIMYTQPATGIEAKNRYNLPTEMNLDANELEAAIAKFYE